MVALVEARTVGGIWFSRDHEEVARRLHRLIEPYVRQPASGRADAGGLLPPMNATRALEELALQLATLRDGRKAIIYVGHSLGSFSGDLTLDFYEMVTTLNKTNTSVAEHASARDRGRHPGGQLRFASGQHEAARVGRESRRPRAGQRDTYD
jgi:hypothetical protein